MRKIIFTCLIILIFSGGGAYAQIKTFSIEEAITMALENNRDVAVARLNIAKADAAVSEAFGYALPSLDLTGNLAHMLEKPKTAFPDFEAMLTNASYNILFKENLLPEDKNKFMNMESKLQSLALTNTFETKLQLTQILFNSAVFRGIGASKIYRELAEEQYRSAASGTVLETKKAFYGVLLTGELLEIMKKSYENALENLNNIKALHKQGLTSDYDAMQAEVQIENIKPALKELENTHENAKNNLKMVLGIKLSENIATRGSFDFINDNLPESDILTEAAVKDNYNLKTLRKKKEVDNEFINIERSDYWPTLAAFGSYTYAGSSNNWDFMTYNSSMVGLSLSINLFNGWRTSNKIEQAKISSLQTDEQIQLTEDKIRIGTNAKILEIERVKSQIQALERNVELANKVYSIASTRYKEGTGTQLEVKNADIELRSARTNLVKARHDYIIAKAELDDLLGKNDYTTK